MRERRALPAPAESDDRGLPVPSDIYRSGGFASDPEAEPPSIPLSHYFWVIKRHRWKILGFVLISVICTYIVSKRLTPIFESTATIYIDNRMPTTVVGQSANTSAGAGVTSKPAPRYSCAARYRCVLLVIRMMRRMPCGMSMRAEKRAFS